MSMRRPSPTPGPKQATTRSRGLPSLGAVTALACVTMVVTSHSASASSDPPRPGDVVFRTDFDTAPTRAAWSQAPFATWEGGGGFEGTTGLRITVPVDQADAASMIRCPLDLKRYRGCRLLFECLARADAVSRPTESWNGVKFMLHYASPTAGSQWHHPSGLFGTFDWQSLSFTARIADDADQGEIDLGLQGSSGSVWFDSLKVTVQHGPPPQRPQPMANPGPAFRGHNLPRLRGVMSPNTFRDEDLRVLGMDWKANVIRWQITRNWGRAGTDRDLEEYDRWFGGKLDELDEALKAARRYGLMVVIDMHSPPGGRYENNDLAIFNEAVYQDHYVALWEKIARRYRGNPVIWGYDLINEPVQNQPSPPGVADYLGTQVRAAKAIRAIDAEVPIFIAAAEWDSAAGFRELEPVAVSNVIYQVHLYVPGEFTHQGVNNPRTGVAYPGRIGGVDWNKERLRRELQPVRDFQLAYNVHLYVGEFSAIRWAPGAVDYLRDCIELFEEYGWDWTYHAYREWDGWSVEHGQDRDDHRPSVEPTDRHKLLLDWFARNEKPEFRTHPDR